MIIIDSNEAELIEYCQTNKIPFKQEQIRFNGERMGDVTNELHTFLLERKKNDFWDIPHTQEQMEKMLSLDENMRLILCLEFTLTDFIKSYDKYCATMRKLSRTPMPLDWGVSLMIRGLLLEDFTVLFLTTPQEIIEFSILMDNVSQKFQGEPYFRRTSKKEYQPLTLLCSIKGIGKVLGQRLLKAFGQPLSVFLATDEDLMRVEGIGKSKIKSIRDHVEGME